MRESDLMKYELKRFHLDKKEFDKKFNFAEKNFFSLGLKDVSEEIGKENAKWFMANIHSIQEKLGYKKQAMVVGTPSFTFQTSSAKFRKGIPEGVIFMWGDNTNDFILADLEFDFCGFLIGTVENNLGLEGVLDSLYRIRKKRYEIDNVTVEKSFFWPGSHFLKIFTVKDYETLDLLKYMVVLHTSSNIMRNQLKKFVQERSTEIETNFGKSHILLGKDAREYMKLGRYASDFSKRKRELLFKDIFNGVTIANRNHCDLIGLNEAIIGCDIVKEGEISVISLTNRAYLVKGKKNLSPEKIKEYFGSRTIEGWAYDYLLNLNIVPHGGGHTLPGVNHLEKIILYPKSRIFVLNYSSRTEAYEDMWNIPRDYRIKGILEKVQSLGLADHYADLQLIHTIKVDF